MDNTYCLSCYNSVSLLYKKLTMNEDAVILFVNADGIKEENELLTMLFRHNQHLHPCYEH
jgi:hypothetical protein